MPLSDVVELKLLIVSLKEELSEPVTDSPVSQEKLLIALIQKKMNNNSSHLIMSCNKKYNKILPRHILYIFHMILTIRTTLQRVP